MLILQQESEEIDMMKKMCCFQIAGNKYQVKLGVKLAINNLIQSLKLKQEQQKKKEKDIRIFVLYKLSVKRKHTHKVQLLHQN